MAVLSKLPSILTLPFSAIPYFPRTKQNRVTGSAVLLLQPAVRCHPCPSSGAEPRATDRHWWPWVWVLLHFPVRLTPSQHMRYFTGFSDSIYLKFLFFLFRHLSKSVDKPWRLFTHSSSYHSSIDVFYLPTCGFIYYDFCLSLGC